ncbi:hypothetical protein F8388_019364 [Cannabis sativa]|uniref:Uncharacterized protein n=1 Tax=Cannabis sativa TaxID=3483 RepID=A0A7J6FRB1_CANSA|nr:hypothetical protein F8388_019364 [Cannabis sativa]
MEDTPRIVAWWPLRPFYSSCFYFLLTHFVGVCHFPPLFVLFHFPFLDLFEHDDLTDDYIIPSKYHGGASYCNEYH